LLVADSNALALDDKGDVCAFAISITADGMNKMNASQNPSVQKEIELQSKVMSWQGFTGLPKRERRIPVRISIFVNIDYWINKFLRSTLGY